VSETTGADMTLRRKTLLIVGITNILLILVLYALSRIIVLGSFARLEKQLVRQNVERALSALSDQVHTLDTMVFDWAAWDDTCAFIEDGNQEYIRSNLVDETFISPRLNLMLFADASGQIVLGKAFDLETEQEIPVPKDLQEYLSANPYVLRHPDTESSITGILLIPEGPLLIASRPILTSEEVGPIRGTLIMGRYFDATEVENLARVTRLSISVYPIDDPQMPADFQTALPSLSAETTTFVRPLSTTSVAGYTFIEDVYGNPALVMRVDMPREVYVQGESSVLYFILALVGISLVLGFVIILFLEKAVLSRLVRLSNDVSDVGTGHDFSVRVPVAGNDELSDLANAINETLSELEQVQGDLKESENRYRLLFNSGTDLVLVSEVASEGMPGKIIEANEIACQRLGYTKEEFLGLTPLEIIASEGRRDSPTLAQRLSKEESILFEATVITKAGTQTPAEISVHLFEFDGRPGLLFVVRDLADRRRTEEALRASEQRFQDVACAIGDWIWEMDAKGRYTYANPVVEQILGYAPEEIVGCFYHAFFHPSNRERLKTQVRQFFRKKKMFVNFVSSNTHKDGWEVILETTGSPLVDAQGHLLGYRGVHRDITTEMEVERSLNAIATLGRGLVLSRDEQQIASTTVNAVRLLLRCHLCELWLVNKDAETITNLACLVRGQTVEVESLPVDSEKSIVAAVIRSGEPIYVLDVQQDSRFIDARLGTRSELCVPLKVEERVIGALNVECEQADGFGRSERQLLSALADQAALAIENAHLYAEMRAGRDRLQVLSSRLVEVRENERRHIARELHDEIGQLLTGLKLVLQMSGGAKATPDGGELDEALDLVDELLGRVRGLTLSLRATMLDDLGLLPALRWHFEHYTTQTDVRVAFKHVGLEDKRFTPEIETAAYRIIQESLTNVARHAGVDEVTVRLWADWDTLGLQVQDTGKGFEVDAALNKPVSSGLSGMHERVSLLDGHLTIDSTPGSGTTITAEFPLVGISTRPLSENKIVEEE
jgi:PAS domain S-box-containing protein